MKALLLIIVATLLTGCAAKVLTSSPRSVTVQAGQVMIAEAHAIADAECQKHKRFARLVLRPTNHTPNHWVFDCVE